MPGQGPGAREEEALESEGPEPGELEPEAPVVRALAVGRGQGAAERGARAGREPGAQEAPAEPVVRGQAGREVPEQVEQGPVEQGPRGRAGREPGQRVQVRVGRAQAGRGPGARAVPEPVGRARAARARAPEEQMREEREQAARAPEEQGRAARAPAGQEPAERERELRDPGARGRAAPRCSGTATR
ncbi:hypothetical protein ACH4A1_22945 [Streptomyces roseoverticillatus]|uniref:hypothetical protein n=1 Tax=Streptomyces roseoverticillatus TaxID=66429 RepID=UPI003794B4CE